MLNQTLGSRLGVQDLEVLDLEDELVDWDRGD